MMNDIDVIAPNLKRRLSGVTATVVRLVPMQARRIGIVTTGPGLPADMPHVALHRLPFLPRRRRVWHARRNVEDEHIGRRTRFDLAGELGTARIGQRHGVMVLRPLLGDFIKRGLHGRGCKHNRLGRGGQGHPHRDGEGHKNG